jgi:hypothetical protein
MFKCIILTLAMAFSAIAAPVPVAGIVGDVAKRDTVVVRVCSLILIEPAEALG